MIVKDFDAIGKSDIDALVGSKVAEGRDLDYKQELPGGTDDEKKEFLADVSSFANAGGGDLVFGIVEERDGKGKATGIPANAIGLSGVNADAEIRRLVEMARSGIAPRIPSIRIKSVDQFAEGPVILLRIAASWAAPHMVTFKNTSRFFSRTSAGKYQLDVREIRAAFTASESLGEKIRDFRSERIARIIADETPIRLLPNPKLILHVVPLSFADSTKQCDFVPLINEPGKVRPLFVRFGWVPRINFDGYLVYQEDERQGASSGYVQVFRSGAFEAVDAQIIY